VITASESLGDWLDSALSGVPQELAVGIRAALPANWRDAALIDGTSILTEAAMGELRGLLDRGCETRHAAAGLLTVDALVTYACELLAYTGADIDAATIAILDAIAATLPQTSSAA
jgi:hypothetical protein